MVICSRQPASRRRLIRETKAAGDARAPSLSPDRHQISMWFPASVYCVVRRRRQKSLVANSIGCAIWASAVRGGAGGCRRTLRPVLYRNGRDRRHAAGALATVGSDVQQRRHGGGGRAHRRRSSPCSSSRRSISSLTQSAAPSCGGGAAAIVGIVLWRIAAFPAPPAVSRAHIPHRTSIGPWRRLRTIYSRPFADGREYAERRFASGEGVSLGAELVMVECRVPAGSTVARDGRASCPWHAVRCFFPPSHRPCLRLRDGADLQPRRGGDRL